MKGISCTNKAVCRVEVEGSLLGLLKTMLSLGGPREDAISGMEVQRRWPKSESPDSPWLLCSLAHLAVLMCMYLSCSLRSYFLQWLQGEKSGIAGFLHCSLWAWSQRCLSPLPRLWSSRTRSQALGLHSLSVPSSHLPWATINGLFVLLHQVPLHPPRYCHFPFRKTVHSLYAEFSALKNLAKGCLGMWEERRS